MADKHFEQTLEALVGEFRLEALSENQQRNLLEAVKFLDNEVRATKLAWIAQSEAVAPPVRTKAIAFIAESDVDTASRIAKRCLLDDAPNALRSAVLACAKDAWFANQSELRTEVIRLALQEGPIQDAAIDATARFRRGDPDNARAMLQVFLKSPARMSAFPSKDYVDTLVSTISQSSDTDVNFQDWTLLARVRNELGIEVETSTIPFRRRFWFNWHLKPAAPSLGLAFERALQNMLIGTGLLVLVLSHVLETNTSLNDIIAAVGASALGAFVCSVLTGLVFTQAQRSPDRFGILLPQAVKAFLFGLLLAIMAAVGLQYGVEDGLTELTEPSTFLILVTVTLSVVAVRVLVGLLNETSIGHQTRSLGSAAGAFIVAVSVFSASVALPVADGRMHEVYVLLFGIAPMVALAFGCARLDRPEEKFSSRSGDRRPAGPQRMGLALVAIAALLICYLHILRPAQIVAVETGLQWYLMREAEPRTLEIAFESDVEFLHDRRRSLQLRNLNAGTTLAPIQAEGGHAVFSLAPGRYELCLVPAGRPCQPPELGGQRIPLRDALEHFAQSRALDRSHQEITDNPNMLDLELSQPVGFVRLYQRLAETTENAERDSIQSDVEELLAAGRKGDPKPSFRVLSDLLPSLLDNSTVTLKKGALLFGPIGTSGEFAFLAGVVSDEASALGSALARSEVLARLESRFPLITPVSDTALDLSMRAIETDALAGAISDLFAYREIGFDRYREVLYTSAIISAAFRTDAVLEDSDGKAILDSLITALEPADTGPTEQAKSFFVADGLTSLIGLVEPLPKDGGTDGRTDLGLSFGHWLQGAAVDFCFDGSPGQLMPVSTVAGEVLVGKLLGSQGRPSLKPHTAPQELRRDVTRDCERLGSSEFDDVSNTARRLPLGTPFTLSATAPRDLFMTAQSPNNDITIFFWGTDERNSDNYSRIDRDSPSPVSETVQLAELRERGAPTVICVTVLRETPDASCRSDDPVPLSLISSVVTLSADATPEVFDNEVLVTIGPELDQERTLSLSPRTEQRDALAPRLGSQAKITQDFEDLLGRLGRDSQENSPFMIASRDFRHEQTDGDLLIRRGSVVLKQDSETDLIALYAPNRTVVAEKPVQDTDSRNLTSDRQAGQRDNDQDAPDIPLRLTRITAPESVSTGGEDRTDQIDDVLFPIKIGLLTHVDDMEKFLAYHRMRDGFLRNDLIEDERDRLERNRPVELPWHRSGQALLTFASLGLSPNLLEDLVQNDVGVSGVEDSVIRFEPGAGMMIEDKRDGRAWTLTSSTVTPCSFQNELLVSSSIAQRIIDDPTPWLSVLVGEDSDFTFSLTRLCWERFFDGRTKPGSETVSAGTYYVVMQQTPGAAHVRFLPNGTVLRSQETTSDRNAVFDVVLGYSNCGTVCSVGISDVAELGATYASRFNTLPSLAAPHWGEQSLDTAEEGQWIDRRGQFIETTLLPVVPFELPR